MDCTIVSNPHDPWTVQHLDFFSPRLHGLYNVKCVVQPMTHGSEIVVQSMMDGESVVQG
jgi:hypothetical protein